MGIIASDKQLDVFTALTELIRVRDLCIGDRLPPEIELAREIGVGRSTVREALSAWKGLGIVSRNKGAGTVLTADVTGVRVGLPLAVALEAVSLLRTLEVRHPLEIEAVRLAALRADARQRHSITGRMLDLLEVHASGADWRPADWAFHAAIHDATGNPLFGQIVTQLQVAFSEVYAAPFGQRHLGSGSIPLHRPLAEAIADGDADRATATMEEIMLDVKRAAHAAAEDRDDG